MLRRASAIVTLLLAALALTAACSPGARYRVMSFFLDGVPPPGSGRTTAAGTASGEAAPGVQEVPQPPPPVRQYYAHAPYRDDRCGGCHDVDTGQLVKPLSEGLCLNCHGPLIRPLRYLHGPVAVNDCSVCHHHHAAPFPKLLLVEPTATCLNCHDRDDLTPPAHPAEGESRACIECHDPHGGADRFFLKRGQP